VPAATKPGADGKGKVGAGNLGAAVTLVWAGAFSGAPTGISQRCLGIPCAGFNATAVVGIPDWLWGLASCTGAPSLTGAWLLKAPLTGDVVVVISLFLFGPHPVKAKRVAASKI